MLVLICTHIIAAAIGANACAFFISREIRSVR
jgi:hypothetical protein